MSKGRRKTLPRGITGLYHGRPGSDVIIPDDPSASPIHMPGFSAWLDAQRSLTDYPDCVVTPHCGRCWYCLRMKTK